MTTSTDPRPPHEPAASKVRPLAKEELCSLDRIRVFMYHRVVREKDSCSPWTVRADLFRGHLEILKQHGYSTITLAECVASLETHRRVPPKSVILTFDDGYIDFLEVALPLLQEYRMKAVLFAVADPKVRTNYWDGENAADTAPLMERHQLLEVHRCGCEVGSHTLTHPRLPELNEGEMWREICTSRGLLEQSLGIQVSSFCYPFGLVNESCKCLVKKAGYKVACAAWTGPVRMSRDLYEIRRILVPHDMSPGQLWRRIALPYQHYRCLIWHTQQVLKKLSGSSSPPK